MGNVVKEVNDFNVEMFDNGYTIRYSGRSEDDEWADVKLIVGDVDELCKIVRDIVKIPRR